MGRRTDDQTNLYYFEPRNKAQEEAIKVYQENDIVFLLGPAGVGKTALAVAFALSEIGPLSRSKNRITEIIVTRPIVEAGEHLGHLPGVIAEKVDPYMQPIFNCVHRMAKDGEAIIKKYFKVLPLAFQRGYTFSNSVAILDEAQNCTHSQLKLFLTRLGQNSKMIITADPEQSDIGKLSGLVDTVNKLKDIEGLGIIKFDEADIVRHPLVGQILKRLAK